MPAFHCFSVNTFMHSHSICRFFTKHFDFFYCSRHLMHSIRCHHIFSSFYHRIKRLECKTFRLHWYCEHIVNHNGLSTFWKIRRLMTLQICSKLGWTIQFQKVNFLTFRSEMILFIDWKNVCCHQSMKIVLPFFERKLIET